MKLASFVLIFLLSSSAIAQQSQLAGRVIEMTLIKADDLSLLPWPSTPIQLKAVPATSSTDQNVYMMLQANGIAPDSQAFTVVYDLNPSITDLDSLAANTSLELPAVTGGEQIQALLKGGDLVRLTVDPDVRNQINQQAEGLQAFAASINILSSDPEAQTEIRSLLGWYEQVDKRFHRRTDPPLRRDTLLEMQTEADLLNKILTDASQNQRVLNDTEESQIKAIYADMKLEMVQYGQTLAGNTPKAQSFYSVTVNIKNSGRKSVDDLRVYYTYNGLFRSLPAQPPIPSYGFKNLGSGKSENLLMKNYQIWAAKDGDANHPVTPPYLLQIDTTTTSPVNVDLSLTGVPQR
jgi:hypothetical protein